ncbi:MAG: hypothetical protein P8Y53_15860, partial [Pseudolabrys sp.]
MRDEIRGCRRARDFRYAGLAADRWPLGRAACGEGAELSTGGSCVKFKEPRVWIVMAQCENGR